MPEQSVPPPQSKPMQINLLTDLSEIIRLFSQKLKLIVYLYSHDKQSFKPQKLLESKTQLSKISEIGYSFMSSYSLKEIPSFANSFHQKLFKRFLLRVREIIEYFTHKQKISMKIEIDAYLARIIEHMKEISNMPQIDLVSISHVIRLVLCESPGMGLGPPKPLAETQMKANSLQEIVSLGLNYWSSGHKIDLNEFPEKDDRNCTLQTIKGKEHPDSIERQDMYNVADKRPLNCAAEMQAVDDTQTPDTRTTMSPFPAKKKKKTLSPVGLFSSLKLAEVYSCLDLDEGELNRRRTLGPEDDRRNSKYFTQQHMQRNKVAAQARSEYQRKYRTFMATVKARKSNRSSKKKLGQCENSLGKLYEKMPFWAQQQNRSPSNAFSLKNSSYKNKLVSASGLNLKTPNALEDYKSGKLISQICAMKKDRAEVDHQLGQNRQNSDGRLFMARDHAKRVQSNVQLRLTSNSTKKVAIVNINSSKMKSCLGERADNEKMSEHCLTMTKFQERTKETSILKSRQILQQFMTKIYEKSHQKASEVVEYPIRQLNKIDMYGMSDESDKSEVYNGIFKRSHMASYVNLKKKNRVRLRNQFLLKKYRNESHTGNETCSGRVDPNPIIKDRKSRGSIDNAVQSQKFFVSLTKTSVE